jgi:hypothetical protein
MMKIIGRFCLVLLSLTLISHAVPSAAAGNDDAPVSYKVQRGDTLINLGDKYFANASAYRIVQRENGVRDPKILPVGKLLMIRRSLLKHAPANAKILSVRGNVTVTNAAETGQAKTGQIITEGSRIVTSASSFVTLVLSDGSRISLPSNSDVRIRLMRNYVLGGSLDYDFDVLKGGARSKVSPLKSTDDRYRVRTPKAVSAVRGTDFQSRYDADANRDFAEVVEGNLAVGQGDALPSDLPAGQGLTVSSDGNVIRENLLPEPKLIEPGKIQANPELLFRVTPANGENGYRFLWAADAGFVDQIADVSVSGSEVKLPNVDNGNYFVRVRAISANGLQGNPATFAFKRRLNGVKASAGAGADGYSFKWLAEGEGKRSFHFQLFLGQPTGLAMIDETALEKSEISISDLPPGEYFWRVGAVQYLDNEVTTNWTDFEKLSVAP